MRKMKPLRLLSDSQMLDKQIKARKTYLREQRRARDELEKILSRESAARLLPAVAGYENQLVRDTARLLGLKTKIQHMIADLNGWERLVMELRYIHHLKWDAVAEHTKYSLRVVHRIHKEAMEKLYALYGERNIS